MVDLSTGSEIGRLDHHSPANFLPENYSFVGCFHNRFTFGLGRFTNWDKVAKDLLGRLGSNPRPHGPSVTNCDHCGAAIAFVGVFQHKDGDYIAVGNICAENRFPLSNVEFDRLRKAHRLGSAARRAEAKFEEFKLAHPEVDWTAAEASTNSFIVYNLRQGRKYGSLFDYRLTQITTALVQAATVAAAPIPVAPVAAPAPVSAEIAFLRAYTGSNGFLNSLKNQDAAGRTLSARQLECVAKNIAQASPQAQAQAAVNLKLDPGFYIGTDQYIYKVVGNGAFKSALKAQQRALKDGQAGIDPHTAHGARVYAKRFENATGPLTVDDFGNLDSAFGWRYDSSHIRNLVVDHPMTVEEAGKFGQLTSQCINCGKHLEDTASYGQKYIKLGVGPECIKKFAGWQHVELAAS